MIRGAGGSVGGSWSQGDVGHGRWRFRSAGCALANPNVSKVVAGLLAVGVLAVMGCTSAVAAPVGAFTDFTVPTLTSQPLGIASGPDGNLWFTELAGNQIGRVTPTGTFTEFPIPTPNTAPFGIAAGPDGNLWFTEFVGNQIGRVTPAGTFTEFSIPTPSSAPHGIAAGPDGNLWFTEFGANQIGRVTPTGTFTEFPIPTLNSVPEQIAAGPDGNLWFTESNASEIGRITPTGTITEFPTPTPNSAPFGIAAGPDGNLWFTERDGNQIGRITPTGTITEFAVPTGNSKPTGIASGPDGDLWFTENNANTVGRVTPVGTITEFPVTFSGNHPYGIAAGPDGNLWFTQSNGNEVGAVGAGAPAASVRAPTVTGSGQPGAQQACQGDQWTQWAGLAPSYGAFSFDGYQWLRDGLPIVGQTGQSYLSVAGDVGHLLACTITVTYALPLDVTTAATSASITVTPQNSGPTGPQGSAGSNGTNGEPGAAGTNGANGAPGAAGTNGINGAPGARGAAGKVELVTCQTIKVKHKPKQRCATKLVTNAGKFTHTVGEERAALSLHGVIEATGWARRTRVGTQIWLLAAGHLTQGRYTLALVPLGRHPHITRTQVTIP